jgi:transposase
MARKTYSDEFRRQAVELYESTPGATVKGIAEDLGIERTTLRLWLDRLGCGTRTAADGSTIRDSRPAHAPRQQTGSPGRAADGAAGSAVDTTETTEQRLARLETENAALRAEKAKLVTEREILRQAAKYFAGETNW